MIRFFLSETRVVLVMHASLAATLANRPQSYNVMADVFEIRIGHERGAETRRSSGEFDRDPTHRAQPVS